MSNWSPVPATLAPYATRDEGSRGRLYPEPPSSTRGDFRRDCDRVLHSSAFRRLKYKTQVFVDAVGQNYRTRLTHSLEVSQIARSMARTLGLNEDLTEALSLSHDLGHTCFGHAGEDALKDCMAPFGGFDHNAQSLRVVTHLECRYAGFDGLNLTWETLEGLVKHNGPLEGGLAVGSADVPPYVRGYSDLFDLELATFAGPEAQVASISDDIAYNAHDLDDGLRARFVEIDAVEEVPLIGRVLGQVRTLHPRLDRRRLINETIRRVITLMIEDVCRETRLRLGALAPASVWDIRRASRPVVAFSPEMSREVGELQSFLFTNLYRHYRVNRMTSKARRVVKDLFARFLEEPKTLPDNWRSGTLVAGELATARVTCDYIAGMTDHFALDEHARLFDPFVRP